MQPGAIIAQRYKIERELGKGGCGAVYVAIDGKFGERVALKLAAASGTDYDAFRAAFRSLAKQHFPYAMAVKMLLKPLGMSAEEAAWGIHAMVNLNMELATRVVSIERGFDPRRLALVATGGSGPVHGCRLVQALGIETAILPAASGVASAIGLLVAEIKFDVSRTLLGRLDALEPAAVEAALRRVMHGSHLRLPKPGE